MQKTYFVIADGRKIITDFVRIISENIPVTAEEFPVTEDKNLSISDAYQIPVTPALMTETLSSVTRFSSSIKFLLQV